MNRREFLFSTAAFTGLAGCVSIKTAKKKDGGRMLIGACRPNADAALWGFSDKISVNARLFI